MLVKILTLLIALYKVIATDNSYAIIGSKYIQPGANFKVFVVSDSIHEDPYDLHIELTGEGYSDVKNVAFDSDSELHKEVEFRQIPANSNGTFHLRTWQNGDKDAKSVDLKTDKVVVIIQTDKVVYRTNDVIEYKVIPLNSNYQPITVAKMTVMVSDADGNVVQADLVKKESNYQNILKLSESPVTGMWKIEVMIDKVKHKKEIEVKDSTLVPFYVSIDTKKHLTIEYDNIVADIWAKDENGEYVSGSVKVKAKVYDSEYPELMKFEVSKDFKIIDKKTVSFDMKREMRIFNILGKNLVELEVIFQKTFPYVSQTGSSKIRLHRRDEYQIDFSKVQKQFKPDLNYRFFAFVTKSDGSLLMDKSNPIKVTTTFYTKSVEFCDKDVEEKVKILEDDFFMTNGYADVQIKVPKDAVKMKILSKYQDASKTINVSRSYGVSDKFISLSMVTKRPNLAKYVVFKIESSEEIDHIYYVFLGPNGPFLSDVRKFDSNNNVHELQFNRTQILSPKCQLVVYYFHASGDFIYDKIPVEISLPNKSTNYLNLAYGSETNEINFNTDKNAFVGILEMDAATLNRTFDKDFATKIIMEHFGLKGFEGKDGNLYPTFEPDKSNSFLITNTNVSRKACITSYSRGEDVIPSDTFNKGGFLIAEQIDEPNANNDEIVSSQQPKDSVLQQSQAYNIQSINADNDGSGNVKIKNKNIPIAVAGFSLHPTKGLIISEPTLIDNKENNLKLEIHPPHTVIRDEIFGIPCVLTNIGSKIVIGTLTLHKNNDELSDIYKVKSKCHESNNQQSKRATILPSNTTQSYFLVSALRTGLVNISVQFTPNDEIQQITSSAFVSVKHAPNINKLSKSAFVDIHESTKELNLTEFKNDDNKPMEVEVNAYADIMLLSLDNLDDLVDQPFGLGEQAIFKLATSLIAYEYLEKKKTLNDDTKKKLSDRILAGYLDILSFKHVDGSFKVKKSDNYGNVWLTAFVLKNLIHANQKSLIYLEKSAIEKTIKFIGKNNIADNAIAALLFEASSYSNDYKIELENLAKKFKSNQNTDRNIALQSYVSQLELTPHLNNLQSLTFNDQSTQLKTQEQIETASYAIMVLVEAGRIDDAIEIAKWLIKHQNYNGGFYTIRDTVIGLQALAKLSLAIADKYKTFKITIEGMTLHINSNNEIQKGKFNMQQNIVQVSLEENGFGVIHIRTKKSFEANVLTENKKVTFGTQQRQPASNVKIYDFTVCPTYNETNRDEIIKKYGADIIVLEVVLPSGYFFDTDTLASYKEFSYIEKVEVTEKKKIVKFFLNDVPDKITCIQVKTFLLNSVGFPRRSFVRMYQYYNLNDVAIKFKDTETGFCS